MGKSTFLFLLVISFSCSKSHRSESLSDDGKTISLTFTIDSVSSNYNKLYQILEGDSVTELYVLNPYINGIDIYSLREKTLKNRIILSKEGPQSINQISGFYVFNKDSILAFSEKSLDGLFIIHGLPAQRVSDYINLENNKYVNFFIASGLPVIAYKQKLFIYTLPFKRDPNFSKYQDLDVVLDFAANKVDKVFSNLYFDDVQKWGSLDAPARYLNPTNGSLIYSYPFLEELMIYDIETKTFSYKKLGSSYFDTATRPLSAYKNEDKYLLENNYYDVLLFNNATKHYYRFARHFINLKTTFGEDRTALNQPVSVIIADENLNKLNEIVLSPPEKYLVKDFFMTKDGLYISNANPNNENIDEDTMSFYLIDN